MKTSANNPYPRDLLGHGRHPPHAQWPGRARVAVQFVLNFEEGAENSVLHGDAASEQINSVRDAHRKLKKKIFLTSRRGRQGEPFQPTQRRALCHNCIYGPMLRQLHVDCNCSRNRRVYFPTPDADNAFADPVGLPTAARVLRERR